ncbi:replicative helicase [Caudoviricetes sp.]|nr:replicative helicase [Caudoviricetes sp.]
MGSQKKANYQQKQRVDSIFDLIEEGAAEDLLELSEKTEVAYLVEFQEEAMEYLKNEGQYMGISTGYEGVNRLLGSFLPGELLTIGGDTGHGKSLLAMNTAQNVYAKEQKPVLLVNLELTRYQAVQRFYNLSQDHDYAGILIQRAPAVSYRDIDVLMQRAKDEGACLVVIDHLHFFSRMAENEARELSRITKHFKECAVQHELPVILLSHVTPTRIMAPDGSVKKEYKPGLHNLKGSSSIEQDSDMVGFVYRKDGESEMEFYLRKNRSRPLNTQSTHLKQKGWKLEEDPVWLPTNLGQSGK